MRHGLSKASRPSRRKAASSGSSGRPRMVEVVALDALEQVDADAFELVAADALRHAPRRRASR